MTPDAADLTKFMPMGDGLYGTSLNHLMPPFKLAPETAAESGVIFFDSGIHKEDFIGLCRLWDIAHRDIRPDWPRKPDKHFVRYEATAVVPAEEGYLRQIRLVNRFALRFAFGSLAEQDYDAYPEQDLTQADTLWQFIEEETEKYGTMFGHPALDGKFGGDGDFMQESLSFGMALENSYYHVVRLWSRGWLVTK